MRCQWTWGDKRFNFSFGCVEFELRDMVSSWKGSRAQKRGLFLKSLNNRCMGDGLRIVYRMGRLEITSLDNCKVYINDWLYRALDILQQVQLDITACMSSVLFKYTKNKSGFSSRMELNLSLSLNDFLFPPIDWINTYIHRDKNPVWTYILPLCVKIEIPNH